MAAPLLDASQLSSYLKRIGLHNHNNNTPSQPKPSLATLSQLHWGHLTSIPFENLSLRVEKAKCFPVSTKLPEVHRKLVESKRGGYCYEMNGLFGAALRSLGFQVMDGGARVVIGPAASGDASRLDVRARTHQILFVELEGGQEGGLWLADVGLGGDLPPLPLRLPYLEELASSPGQEVWEAEECWAPFAGCDWAQGLPVERMAPYRLRLGVAGSTEVPRPQDTPQFPHRVGFYLQKRSSAGGYRDIHFCRIEELIPQDFEVYNHFAQTAPSSPFLNNLMCVITTHDGRCTIANDKFRSFKGREVEERQIESEEQLEEILREHFGIHL